ncbi:MAG: hypothetical protein QOG77_2135 [Solirubrobacteraceae bacterium]|nr:hypothetical protein [Solirubrobacteraceae bacterium]
MDLGVGACLDHLGIVGPYRRHRGMPGLLEEGRRRSQLFGGSQSPPI